MERRRGLCLTNLPREMVRLILELLTMEEIGKLDLAILNHHFRPLFLVALHKLPVPVYEDPCYGQKDQPLDWLLVRGVIPLDIKINNFRPKLGQLIANSRSLVQCLAIHDARFSPTTFQALGSFPSLTSFALGDGDDEISQEMVLQFLRCHPQLEKISIATGSDFTDELVREIPLCCPKVTHLDFMGSVWFGDDCASSLAAVAAQLPQLISLDLSETKITDDVIPLLLDSLPRLHQLCLFDCNISLPMLQLCLTRVAMPSLMSSDPKVIFLGLGNLDSLNDVSHLLPLCPL
jgi:hypothetical protein